MYQVEDDDIRIYQLPNAETVSATMKVVVDSQEDGTKSLFANKLMMKPSGGVTSNNLAAFSPTGDVRDSGYSADAFATVENVDAVTRQLSDTDADLQQQILDNIVEVDDCLDGTSTNPVENRAVDAALSSKQDQLTEMTQEEINELIDELN